MKIKSYILSIVLSFLFFQVTASDTILVSSLENEYVLAGKAIDIFEDKTSALSLEEVSSTALRNSFKNYKDEGIYSQNFSSAYWIRFTLEKLDDEEFSPVLEIYDIKTDNIQFFIPDLKGGYTKKETGDIFPFTTREYKHLNFVFDLKNVPKGKTTYYLRLKSNHTIYLYALLRSHQRFVEYATGEYFLLTIFYGIIFAMFVYNIFLFFSLRESVYFYYILYILSISAYSFSRDGLGFQFVWPSLPEINPFIEDASLTCMVVFALLYAKSFINTKKFIPFLDKIIIVTIIGRIIYFILWVLFLHKYISGIYIDIITLAIPYLSGFISFHRGFVPARYYLLGYTMLFLGLLVSVLEVLNIIPTSIFSFYSLHIGVILQMLILTFSMADKVRVLMKENYSAQLRIIQELTEKELLKDQLNKELELKVLERTKELNYRIEQLDTFVYRASHDIKGPLRSLMGLSLLGEKESSDKQIKEYFIHSFKTSTRLDKVLGTLLNMTRSRKTELHYSRIDIEAIFKEILSDFSHHENFKNIRTDIIVNNTSEFHSDKYLLYSILQNLTENAIQYRNGSLESFLEIAVEIDTKKATFSFKDNGTGIKQTHIDKIFDMFVRADESSQGSGLGLFIVKQYVEKLEGTVSVESKNGEGSTFVVTVPNKK